VRDNTQDDFEHQAGTGEGINPEVFGASIIPFPDLLGRKLRTLTNDEVEATFATDQGVHKLHPEDVELSHGETQGTFLVRHKKLGIILGAMTGAAVLGVASTVVYKRRQNSSGK
jgi:hypothetical protein